VSEIRTWLDRIGLAQYTGAFEANDIVIDLLGQVDDQVLKDIGASSAGYPIAHSQRDREPQHWAGQLRAARQQPKHR
jgi:hypothetical protein